MRKRFSSDHVFGLVLASVSMLIISPDALLIRLIEADQWTFLFWRGLLPSLAMMAMLAARYGRQTPALFRAIGRPGLAIAFLFGISTILFISAILLTSVANALVIIAVQPLLSAIFSRWFLGEPIRPSTWVATVVVLAGVAIIFSGSLGGGNVWGDVLAFLGSCCMAGQMVIIRYSRAVNMVPAVVLSGPLVALAALPFATPFAVSGNDVGLLLMLGLIILPVPFFLSALAPRYAPAAEISLITLLESVTGPFIVWLVIDEAPVIETLVGGAVILATLAVYFTISLRAGSDEVERTTKIPHP